MLQTFNATDGLVTFGAYGDQHPDVPAGYVAAHATPGGRGGIDDGKWYLIPASEYTPHMLIDPERHAEAKGFIPYNKEVFRSGRGFGQLVNPHRQSAGSHNVATKAEANVAATSAAPITPAEEIKQLCTIAGTPEKADGFLMAGATPDEVRRVLEIRRAHV